MFICGPRLSKTHGCFWHRLSLVKQDNYQLEGDFVLCSKFQVDNFGKKDHCCRVADQSCSC